MNKLNVVLLAGGNSTRFNPLVEKNLYKFLGKSTPEYQVKKYQKILEINKLVIITNKESEKSIKEILKLHDAEVFVQQGVGQSGAVSTALEQFNEAEDVLIANMNDYFDDSLLKNFQTQLPDLRKNKDAMLTGYKVEAYFPGGYLVLDGNHVVEIQEKPGAGKEPSNYFSSLGRTN